MVEVNPKIIDLIKERQTKNGGSPQQPFTSIEFFPPRTEEGKKNLYSRMERMLVNSQPLFSDITWGAGGSTADLSLEIAIHLKETGHVSNLHMTCTNMDQTKLETALKAAHDAGIRNIVALRGDPPAGQEEWKAAEGGFSCALDLVKYIKSTYGDDFGIAVAGYPEGHPDGIELVKDPSTLSDGEKLRCSTRDGKTYVCRDVNYEKEMKYLKEKVDAGGDIILTQMFFDAQTFGKFVEDCRTLYDIQCPIIPGIMCITAYAGFHKMTGFCKTRVPPALKEKMESIKDDADAVKQFGIEYTAQMCQELLDIGVPGLHFYTLNLEKCVYGVTDTLGWTDGLSTAKKLDSDSKSMAAVGSAWARVGDSVKTIYGQGTVSRIDQSTGMAVITIESWLLAGGQHPTAYLQKGSYEKVFA